MHSSKCCPCLRTNITHITGLYRRGGGHYSVPTGGHYYVPTDRIRGIGPGALVIGRKTDAQKDKLIGKRSVRATNLSS